jgi:hypothetical protein
MASDAASENTSFHERFNQIRVETREWQAPKPDTKQTQTEHEAKRNDAETAHCDLALEQVETKLCNSNTSWRIIVQYLALPDKSQAIPIQLINCKEFEARLARLTRDLSVFRDFVNQVCNRDVGSADAKSLPVLNQKLERLNDRRV